MAHLISPRILSTKEAAIYLGVSHDVIRRMALDGKIHVIKDLTRSWKFDIVELDKLIEQSKEKMT